MIGYHWSPEANEESLSKYGLLVPTRHPRLTKPLVCSEGHRNPHISLGRTPIMAWALSSGFLVSRAREQKLPIWGNIPLEWHLYEVTLEPTRFDPNPVRYRISGCDEIQVRVDIAKHRVMYAGSRFAYE